MLEKKFRTSNVSRLFPIVAEKWGPGLSRVLPDHGGLFEGLLAGDEEGGLPVSVAYVRVGYGCLVYSRCERYKMYARNSSECTVYRPSEYAKLDYDFFY